MSDIEAHDSDAPEELTAEQGIQQDQELRQLQNANKARVIREGKERRRLWAQRKTAKLSKEVKNVTEAEAPRESGGLLPDEIIQLLASRDKQVFLSDSEDDEKIKGKNVSKTKRKPKSSGVDTVVVSEIPLAECLESSLGFLKKRKMQVPRSSAVLKNSNQALRLLK